MHARTVRPLHMPVRCSALLDVTCNFLPSLKLANLFGNLEMLSKRLVHWPRRINGQSLTDGANVLFELRDAHRPELILGRVDECRA
jgi:hypothetical protein